MFYEYLLYIVRERRDRFSFSILEKAIDRKTYYGAVEIV